MNHGFPILYQVIPRMPATQAFHQVIRLVDHLVVDFQSESSVQGFFGRRILPDSLHFTRGDAW